MKKILSVSAFFAVIMLLVPLVALNSAKGSAKETYTPVKDEINSKEHDIVFFDSFRVKDKDSGKITVMDAKSYVFSVVAAEMPALYEPEALKAQAVAAYTFACFRAGEREAEEYDITTDSKIDQSFITMEKVCDLWGDKADEYVTKIKQAVSAVSDMILSYNGKTALSVYHAISPAKTNSAKDVWRKDVPYLVSVLSEGDKTANGYKDTVFLTLDELNSKLKEIEITDGKAFSDINVSDTGYVLSLNVCGKKFSGSEIASALELRSANFDVSFENGSYKFTVFGFGHGVGMSQNGANHMAKQGSSYKEILLHYYKNCEIVKRN